ncbi:MAG: hypothetical protein N2Z23_10800 [Pyrinomonadaceae bacterium]|nr:hypothetical protein [Pyrinomonadaceae bacterium]MCX7640914.1 hypothetical protein [Pyrinomonadaceae bacterium]MDW8304696.1 hypothetical protein [Acidobacteriota bacterium]
MNAKGFEEIYNRTVVVTLALLFSIIMFVSISWIVDFSHSEIPFELEIALWALIVLLAVGVLLLRRFFFSWDRLKAIATSEGADYLLAELQKKTILLAIIAEAITLVGFIIVVLTGNKSSILRAAAVSLILFVMIFPRKSLWGKVVSAAEKLH